MGLTPGHGVAVRPWGTDVSSFSAERAGGSPTLARSVEGCPQQPIGSGETSSAHGPEQLGNAKIKANGSARAARVDPPRPAEARRPSAEPERGKWPLRTPTHRTLVTRLGADESGKIELDYQAGTAANWQTSNHYWSARNSTQQ